MGSPICTLPCSLNLACRSKHSEDNEQMKARIFAGPSSNFPVGLLREPPRYEQLRVLCSRCADSFDTMFYNSSLDLSSGYDDSSDSEPEDRDNGTPPRPKNALCKLASLLRDKSGDISDPWFLVRDIKEAVSKLTVQVVKVSRS